MTPSGSVASRRALVAAEFGLLALALGTAASFTRLFAGWSFLGRLAPFVVLAWLTALVLRRLRAGIGVAVVAHLAVGAVALTWWFAGDSRLLGVLPGPSTVDVLRGEITRSFAEVPELVAPVAATNGFLVVIAAGLWVLALFGDTAAFRYRGNVQAAVPYGAVFVATGILARDSGRVAAAVTFGAGVATYAITQRGLAASERRWIPGDDRRGTRATLAGAAAVAGVALLIGAVAGPLLPAGTEPVVDLRELGKGSGPRTVVSPFVSIRSLLDERSDQIMFRVRAQEPSYWRLTALEEFRPDGDLWVSHGSYDAADEQLPRSVDPEVPFTSLTQRFEIAGLRSDWLPGAYAPDRIESTRPVRYNQSSSSIILADDGVEGDVAYSLESLVPDFSQTEPVPGADHDVDPIHLVEPDLSDEQRSTLDAIVAGAASPMEQMLALQTWFRSEFDYDEDVDYSNRSDPLSAFLEDRRGFCQQFSSAFALLARELGLPSRVAVGFTPGDATSDESGELEYIVRGRHAHAWPEVHFAGIGWVPFEPTPSAATRRPSSTRASCRSRQHRRPSRQRRRPRSCRPPRPNRLHRPPPGRSSTPPATCPSPTRPMTPPTRARRGR